LRVRIVIRWTWHRCDGRNTTGRTVEMEQIGGTLRSPNPQVLHKERAPKLHPEEWSTKRIITRWDENNGQFGGKERKLPQN
jgi:hypothetical protein